MRTIGKTARRLHGSRLDYFYHSKSDSQRYSTLVILSEWRGLLEKRQQCIPVKYARDVL